MSLAGELARLLDRGEPAALVRIEKVEGSAPCAPGATMLVSASGTCGTVGGGRLELEATRLARALLVAGAAEERHVLPLGPEVDQCCGGRVSFIVSRGGRKACEALQEADARERAGWPTVGLFGAGHVGRAIAAALAPLPFRLQWVDERPGQFPAGAEAVVSPDPVGEIARLPGGAAVLVLTHSHMLDFRLCEAALRRCDFAYVGLIGSRSKRRRFEHGLRELGLDPSPLVCPIGGDRVQDKRPAVIAALVAAELLERLSDNAGRLPGDTCP